MENLHFTITFQVCVFDSNQKLEEVLAVQCAVIKTKKEPIRQHQVVENEEDEPIETLHSALIALSTCFLLLIIFIAAYCVYQHNKEIKQQQGYPNLSKHIRQKQKVDEYKVKEIFVNHSLFV